MFPHAFTPTTSMHSYPHGMGAQPCEGEFERHARFAAISDIDDSIHQVACCLLYATWHALPVTVILMIRFVRC